MLDGNRVRFVLKLSSGRELSLIWLWEYMMKHILFTNTVVLGCSSYPLNDFEQSTSCLHMLLYGCWEPPFFSTALLVLLSFGSCSLHN